jgi:hypothetical protein
MLCIYEGSTHSRLNLINQSISTDISPHHVLGFVCLMNLNLVGFIVGPEFHLSLLVIQRQAQVLQESLQCAFLSLCKQLLFLLC